MTEQKKDLSAKAKWRNLPKFWIMCGNNLEFLLPELILHWHLFLEIMNLKGLKIFVLWLNLKKNDLSILLLLAARAVARAPLVTVNWNKNNFFPDSIYFLILPQALGWSRRVR
jgi:hypothetical protein